MRSSARIVLPVVALLSVVSVAGCGRADDEAATERPSEEFCELAYDYDQEIASIGPDDPQGHLDHLEPMVELAPDDVHDDLARFIDALRRVRDGDDSVVDDPDIEAAANRFYSRAIEGCELHDQDPPGGL